MFQGENRKFILLLLQALFLLFTTLAIVIRLFTRISLLRSFAADDWLILAAYVFAVGVTASSYVATNYGWTYRVENVSNITDYSFMLSAWFPVFLWSFAVSFCKLSILVLYRRISMETGFRWLVGGCIAFVSAWMIVTPTLQILICGGPVFHTVDLEFITFNGCVRVDPEFLLIGSMNLVTDMVVLILPMHMVWKCRLPIRTRITTLGLFALGGVACLCGLNRIILFTHFEAEKDVTWHSFHLFLWSSLEADLGIICACAPTIKAFYIHCTKRNIAPIHILCAPSKTMDNPRNSIGCKYSDLEDCDELQLISPLSPVSYRKSERVGYDEIVIAEPPKRIRSVFDILASPVDERTLVMKFNDRRGSLNGIV